MDDIINTRILEHEQKFAGVCENIMLSLIESAKSYNGHLQNKTVTLDIFLNKSEWEFLTEKFKQQFPKLTVEFNPSDSLDYINDAFLEIGCSNYSVYVYDQTHHTD